MEMKIIMEHIYCMIMGSISNLGRRDLDEPQKRLKEALAAVNYDYGIYIYSGFAVTRNNEFGGILYNTIPLFDVLRFIQKSVSPYKMKFGIGLDRLGRRVGGANTFAADGPARHKAQQALEDFKDEDSYEYGYRIYTCGDDGLVINPLLANLDRISSEWTDKQKEYIDSLHKDETVVSLSNRKGVSVSTVSRALTRANYKMINDSLDSLSSYLYKTYDVNDDSESFSFSYNEACRLYADKMYDQALRCIEDAWVSGNADCVNKNFILANIYHQMGLNEESIAAALETLEYITPDYDFMQTRLLNYLGIGYMNTGKPAEAEEYFSKALDLAAGDAYSPKIYLTLKGNMAILSQRKGETDAAKKLYNEIYEAALELHPSDASLRVTALSNLCKIYLKTKEYEKCIETCNMAYDIAQKELNDSDNQIAFLLCMSAVLVIKTERDVQKAIKLLKQSTEIYRKNKNHRSELANYRLLYDLCVKNKENAMAEVYAKKIQKLQDEIGARKHME